MITDSMILIADWTYHVNERNIINWFFSLSVVTLFIVLPSSIYRLIRHKIHLTRTGKPLPTIKKRHWSLTITFAIPFFSHFPDLLIIKLGTPEATAAATAIVEMLLYIFSGSMIALVWLKLYDLSKCALVGKYEAEIEQVRESIEDTEYSLVKKTKNAECVCLFNSDLNRYEMWVQNQYKTGYVLVVDENEYEFSCEVSKP